MDHHQSQRNPQPPFANLEYASQSMQPPTSVGAVPIDINVHMPYGPQPYPTYKFLDHKIAKKLKLVDIVQRFVSCRFFMPGSLHNVSYDQHMRNFVWVALRYSKIFKDETNCNSVVYSALLLLQRVCDRMSFSMLYPQATRPVNSHNIFKQELFLSALIISHRYHCDSTPSLRSWSHVILNMFRTEEINDMVRRMSVFLEFDFIIPITMLATFRELVESDFSAELPIDFDSHYNAYVPSLVSDLRNIGEFKSLERYWKIGPEDQFVERFIPRDEDFS